jgi:hypothetical protein
LSAVVAAAGTVAATAVAMAIAMAVFVVGMIARLMVLGIYTHPVGEVQEAEVGAVVVVGHTRLVVGVVVLECFGSPSPAYSDQRYRRRRHVSATSAY